MHSIKWYPNLFFDVTFRKFENAISGYRQAIASANLVIDRSVFSRVGVFNSSLRMFEDVDLCLRLRKMGYRLFSTGEVAVYHYTSPEGRDGSRSFYANLKTYTRTFHKERVKLVFLNQRHVLAFLPILDLFYGIKIFLMHCCRRYNAAYVPSIKIDKKINLFIYAWYHFLGMIYSYRYGLKTLCRGNL
jgi:GT2 family glycosyltransferase